MTQNLLTKLPARWTHAEAPTPEKLVVLPPDGGARYSLSLIADTDRSGTRGVLVELLDLTPADGATYEAIIFGTVIQYVAGGPANSFAGFNEGARHGEKKALLKIAATLSGFDLAGARNDRV